MSDCCLTSKADKMQSLLGLQCSVVHCSAVQCIAVHARIGMSQELVLYTSNTVASEACIRLAIMECARHRAFVLQSVLLVILYTISYILVGSSRLLITACVLLAACA